MTRKAIFDTIKQARIALMSVIRADYEIDRIEKAMGFLDRQRLYYLKALIKAAIDNSVTEKQDRYNSITMQVTKEFDEQISPLTADYVAEEVAGMIAEKGYFAEEFRCIKEVEPTRNDLFFIVQFKITQP